MPPPAIVSAYDADCHVPAMDDEEPVPNNGRTGEPSAVSCWWQSVHCSGLDCFWAQTPTLETPNASVPAVIRCRNLIKTYEGRPPVEAVRGLDLQVEAGECFGLLGPNGAGKTTTIEILEGLLAPTSGSVEILGREWGKDDDAIRQRIGISFQETKLSEKLTVRETLVLFRSFYRPASRRTRQSITSN